jgi:hypothetical protein
MDLYVYIIKRKKKKIHFSPFHPYIQNSFSQSDVSDIIGIVFF